MAINSFDILKRMGEENKQIMLCPDVLNMKYSKKTQGTRVEVGVPGNVIADILGGDKKAVLLMWDVTEFNEIKAQMTPQKAADREKMILQLAEYLTDPAMAVSWGTNDGVQWFGIEEPALLEIIAALKRIQELEELLNSEKGGEK